MNTTDRRNPFNEPYLSEAIDDPATVFPLV